MWFTKSKFDSQELKWDSPFGVGYPGWHIECSCIAIKNLGEHLDIHCGGVDNIFPHHTNEIAQSEAYLGHKWCNYWVHGEHLNDKSGKMSKSKGDILTVSTLEKEGYNPLSYRYMCLESHYRKPLLFTYEALGQAENAYKKVKNRVSLLKDEGELDEGTVNTYLDKFKDALSDDMNTAMALTVLYEVLKLDTSDKTKKQLVMEFDKVLSLDLLKDDIIDIDQRIVKLIEKRNEAKKNKDYAEADRIRDYLESIGFRLIDSREGTTIEKI